MDGDTIIMSSLGSFESILKCCCCCSTTTLRLPCLMESDGESWCLFLVESSETLAAGPPFERGGEVRINDDDLFDSRMSCGRFDVVDDWNG